MNERRDVERPGVNISIFMLSSFPVIHKVGNVGIFVLLKFENKLDTVFGHFNFNSKHHD